LAFIVVAAATHFYLVKEETKKMKEEYDTIGKAAR
jgi:hypothetical protein